MRFKAKQNNDPKFNSPNELDYFMTGFNYIDFTYLMSPEQVYKMESGSCHDLALFEYNELTKQGLYPAIKFLIAVDEDGIGGETHSFVYYKEGNTFYWFENAWKDYEGIHEFDTEQELLEYVLDAFTERNPRKYIFMADFKPEEHKYGEDLETLVDICMNYAVQM